MIGSVMAAPWAGTARGQSCCSGSSGSRQGRQAWRGSLKECAAPPSKEKSARGETIEEQWYVLVTCRDEKQQVELLTRFQAEGLTCKAVLA
jgi:hypothetical protein